MPHLSEFPKTWDNSMRSMGRECPRKLFFFLEGFEPKTSKAYFVWGSAWHLMMDKWYSSTATNKEKVLEAIAEGVAYFDDNITEESTDNTRDGLIAAFRYYIERYETDPFKLIEGASEQGFQWPLVGSPYFYAGSMDGYIEWPSYGFLVLEHKTTSEYLGDSFIGQWEFSPQVTGYHWYLSKLHEDTYGVLVNMITKKTPGPKSKWTTPRVARTLIRKTKFDLKEFEEDVIRDINYFKTCFDTLTWPKTTNPRNCVGGLGFGACPFKSICLTQCDYHNIDISLYDNLTIRAEEWRPWRRGNE